MRRAIPIFFAAFFAGCAGTNTGSGSGPSPSLSSAPVSEQATTGMAEKSAKTHTELGSLYLESGNLAIALDEARLAARFVLVAMDLDRQRAQAVPDDLRALMLAFQKGEFDINNHQRRDS